MARVTGTTPRRPIEPRPKVEIDAMLITDRKIVGDETSIMEEQE